MAAENGFASGTALLEPTDAGLASFASEGPLDSPSCLMLLQAYAAVGLSAAEPVQLDGEALESIGDLSLLPDGFPDIDDLVELPLVCERPP